MEPTHYWLNVNSVVVVSTFIAAAWWGHGQREMSLVPQLLPVNSLDCPYRLHLLGLSLSLSHLTQLGDCYSSRSLEAIKNFWEKKNFFLTFNILFLTCAITATAAVSLLPLPCLLQMLLAAAAMTCYCQLKAKRLLRV